MTDGLKTAEGRMGRIDTGTRMFTFRPDKEFAVDVFWSVNQDEKVGKFKERHMAKVTYETDKQGKHWLTEIISTYKPTDKASQKPYQKNEGYILFESVFRTRTDLFTETADMSQPVDFDKVCEKILAGIERDYPRILKLVKDGELK